MKVIEAIRRQFAMIGIVPEQSTMSYPFNAINIMVLLMFVIDLVINGVYCFYGAANFREYVNSAFACSALTVSMMAFATLIWEMAKVYQFLANLEKTIKSREYNDFPAHVNLDSNQTIE